MEENSGTAVPQRRYSVVSVTALLQALTIGELTESTDRCYSPELAPRRAAGPGTFLPWQLASPDLQPGLLRSKQERPAAGPFT